MKKIVGIMAAAAMAASMFAVDLSAQLQIDGSLMSYGKDAGFKAVELNQYDPSGSSDYLWKMAVNGDKSGAEIWSWKDDGSVTSKKLWIKPIDALKISFGDITAYSVANPQFGWWAHNGAFEKYGIMAEYTADALTVTAALGQGAGNYWFNTKKADKDNDGKITGYTDLKKYDLISDFWVDAKYATAVGTAQVYVGKNAGIHPHGFTGWGASALAFGAAFANMPYMQNGYYADVAATLSYQDWKDLSWGKNDGFAFEKVVATVGGQYFVSGVGIQALVVGGYKAKVISGNDNWSALEVKSEATPVYGFEAKVSYAAGAYTPYVQAIGYDIQDKKMELDIGVGTSVGSCGIDCKVALPLDFNKGSKFTVSVPVQVNVAF